MKSFDPNMMVSLRDLLAGRVCIVGVGNRQRGDDGAGPRVIDARRGGTRGVWVDAGVTPENFLEPIARTNPDAILIVDAVAFGGIPGECRLMNGVAMDAICLSTHAGSLGMMSEYLSARTGAHLWVLGMQPESIGMREGLSRLMEESVRGLAAMLCEALDSASDR